MFVNWHFAPIRIYQIHIFVLKLKLRETDGRRDELYTKWDLTHKPQYDDKEEEEEGDGNITVSWRSPSEVLWFDTFPTQHDRHNHESAAAGPVTLIATNKAPLTRSRWWRKRGEGGGEYNPGMTRRGKEGKLVFVRTDGVGYRREWMPWQV